MIISYNDIMNHYMILYDIMNYCDISRLDFNDVSHISRLDFLHHPFVLYHLTDHVAGLIQQINHLTGHLGAAVGLLGHVGQIKGGELHGGGFELR